MSIASVSALVVIGGALVGCAHADKHAAAASPALSDRCPVPVISGGLPLTFARESVRIGSLAVYPARTYPALLSDSFRPLSGHGRSARFSAIEAAVVITKLGRVAVSIRKADRRFARLLFDHSKFGNSGYRLADGSATYTFVGCRTPHTQYQGGFVVTRPGCIELDVRVAGQPGVRRGRLKFGTRDCE
jgi:hypothetical protein